VSGGALVLNFLIVNSLAALLHDQPVVNSLRPPRTMYPALVMNVALTLAVAGVYAKFGLAASAFIIIVVVAFNYMYHLIAAARERAREYASLSWGVLSGLVRALEVRDSRSARHSAAVAAFAREIARHCGLSERDCELAHTAGLLHDIGKFALSDRAMDRGGTLAELDWHAIRQHPALGADMLRDLGLYGPVADIVLAHHERPDGRGYPRGIRGDEIPEIAKIVSVAEVYDTLTAEGTYRTRMNSFEALTELRRVSGRQLEGRYVEALAELLAGQGVEYRHRDDADFYRELDLERRINEAAMR
jgi:putative nucleotidyltransferase with HDIG domain